VTLKVAWPRVPELLDEIGDDLLAMADEACARHDVSVEISDARPAGERDRMDRSKVDSWRLVFEPRADSGPVDGQMAHLERFEKHGAVPGGARGPRVARGISSAHISDRGRRYLSMPPEGRKGWVPRDVKARG